MLQHAQPFRRHFQTLAHQALIAAALPLCLTSALAQTARPSTDALRGACSDDAARLCSGVQSGGGRIVSCLKQHQDQLSNRCHQAAGLPPLPNADASPAPDAQPAPAPSIASPALAPPSPDSAPATPPAAVGQPTHVAGETFVRRPITDPAHGNAVAATIHVPEKWTLQPRVEWHYDKVEDPLSFSVSAFNPANAEGFFRYPDSRFQSIEVAPQYRQYMRGRQSSVPIQRPIPALIAFVRQTRPGATNLKFTGRQDLPALPKALGLDPWPGDHGVAVKVSYDLNGQPVEEAFFGVYYLSQGSGGAKSAGQMSMAASAIKQTNWGFRALQSFRAPAGTLDARMSVFCLISKSMVMNPQWVQMAQQVHDQLTAAFNQNLQKGYDQIRAGQAAMQQMQAQEKATDASVAKFDAGLRAPTYNDSWLRTSGGGGSGSGDHLSTTDRASNNIRSQDTAKDATTGENVQLSNAGSYHFTDGFGNYRTSDDPNYTPEKNGESGSWTPMTVVQ